MRTINKGAEPRELIQWKADNVTTPGNLVYGGGGFPGEAVRKSLLLEQLHLCAYTMKHLKTIGECNKEDLDTRASCHVEHILPQARNVAGEDIDYQNMVACYPPSGSKIACMYGAKAKGSFDPSMGAFVSPLSPKAEHHFKFDNEGGIKGLTENGKATIRVLKLDDSALVNDRASVIKGILYPKGLPISAAMARRMANQVMQADGDQCLHPFCTAVASAALAFADRSERRANRLRKKGNQ